MEAVKSYRIPIEAPKDLIEEYFEVKQKALTVILQYVKVSRKAHFEFGKVDRKKLRDELLRDWRYLLCGLIIINIIYIHNII